jgi:hypothetical protein
MHVLASRAPYHAVPLAALEGMRRCLTATVAGLALAFASAGCGKVPVPHVHEKVPPLPNELHDLNNIRKHGSAEKYEHSCRDEEGVPYSC